MSEQSVFEGLLTMKAELEKLGCTVTITPAGAPEKDADGFITVRIVYPSDVAPDDSHPEEVQHG